MPVPTPPLDFPPITGFDGLEDPDRWRWPKPPFVWHHATPAPFESPQRCRVETTDGQVEEGEMLGFNPSRGGFAFRGPATRGREVELTFRQCRRLTLLDPLRPDADAGHPLHEGLPLAEHEHAYRLHPRVPGALLAGRTVGYVESPEGLFLFEPVDDDTALQRVFVPRAANGSTEIDPSALEGAMRGWAATPAALLAACDAMRHRPVPRLGEAILSLGLLTPAQLTAAMARNDGALPMGEALVAAALLTPAQLEAAIAHKMGCPVVDVAHFPADPAAVALMPQRLAMSYRSLPLFADEGRLFVASDQAMGEERQRSIQVIARLPVVPVLARTNHLTAVLRSIQPAQWAVSTM